MNERYISSLDIISKNEDMVGVYSFFGVNEKGFDEIDNKIFMENLLKYVTIQEALVIEESVVNQKTQRQIARQLNISQMQVSRLRNRGLAKIKNVLFEQNIV